MTEVWDDLLLYYVVLGQAKRNFQPVAATVTPATIVATVAQPAAAVVIAETVSPGVIAATTALPAATPNAFSPATVADMRLWLDASALTGLVDADPVSTWADASGNAFDATQTLTKRPLYKTNIINGKPVVRFDGTDDLMVGSATVSAATAGTVFAVATRTSTNATSQTMFASGDEGSSTRYMAPLQKTTLHKVQFGQNDAGTADQANGGTVLTQSQFYIIEVSSSGTAYSMYVNGAIETLTTTSGADTGDWFGDSSARDNFSVGALKRSTESSFLIGDIAEIILYDHAVTQPERDTVEAYLSLKYGITVA